LLSKLPIPKQKFQPRRASAINFGIRDKPMEEGPWQKLYMCR